MFIEGVGFTNYRSFGKEIQRIGPFEKLNFFIGQNNSGKSNILTWLNEWFTVFLRSCQGHSFNYPPLDKHIGSQETPKVEVALRIGGPRYAAILELNSKKHSRFIDAFGPVVRQLLRSMSLTDSDLAWFPYFLSPRNSQFEADLLPMLDKVKSESSLTTHQLMKLWEGLTGRGGGTLEDHWVPETFNALSPIYLSHPNIHLIPAIRRIADPTGIEGDLSGTGIIQKLAELQNPAQDQQYKKQHFGKVNAFLQEVSGNSSALLEVPFKRNTILIHMDGRTLPLTSLGTGIHEVVILAAAATVIEKEIICIEEPELHLHPLLQRKLIRYLRDKTDNQYFITTHSAHLMDTTDAAIFHVKHEAGASRVSPVLSHVERSVVCADLGYRASDLLQANSVIWVEGPSDRIYLKHWLSALAPDLKEGLHYSIMFYGGRLLSHLTANDPEVEEFISLRRLNRHISILMDSDKSTQASKINATKKRIRDEFNKGPGFAWITKGREIENYIPAQTLEASVKSVHKGAARLRKTGQFDHSLHYVKNRKLITDVDKVKVAHEASKRPPNLDVLDLRKQLDKLIAFVRRANEDLIQKD